MFLSLTENGDNEAVVEAKHLSARGRGTLNAPSYTEVGSAASIGKYLSLEMRGHRILPERKRRGHTRG